MLYPVDECNLPSLLHSCLSDWGLVRPHEAPPDLFRLRPTEKMKHTTYFETANASDSPNTSEQLVSPEKLSDALIRSVTKLAAR